ncbi:MAG TPA: hypothetical protein VMJ75_06995 [Candidatus Acidoferrales bacterium]|nr:hypothetical protein [Candidatus Acidoferrales bacterium]
MHKPVPLALLLSFVGISSGAQAQSLEPGGESFTLSARWSQYLHRTFGATRLGILAAETAVDQGLGDPACWDDSATSYVQRYARAFDRRLIKNTVEFATGALTGEDLRYRQSRSRSTRARFWNALQSSVTARMPDGTRRPAYTRFFASATTELSTAHWTGQRIQTVWLLQSMGWSTLDQVQTNLLDEFGPDLRRTAGRIWDAARNRTRIGPATVRDRSRP